MTHASFSSAYRFLKLSLALLVLNPLYGCDRIKDLNVGKGFSAKYMCSYIFNSGLDEQLVKNVFVAPKVQPLPLFWNISVDRQAKMVTVADRIFLNESAKAKAIYREGLGCTLLVNAKVEDVTNQAITPWKANPLPENLPWPEGQGGIYPEAPAGLDQHQLDISIEKAFTETGIKPLNTTSLLVAYNGRLIAERYALGAKPDAPLMGWSMTKSITGTLIGLLYDRGLIQLDDPAPISAWQSSEKSAITIRDLLHMTSGLNFNEDYGKKSDVTRMLYENADQTAYAAQLPLVNEPGTHFNYNTGDANLLAKVVQETVGGSSQQAYDFMQNELFHPIGVNSAFIEFDVSGQFIGGAYGFMTGRDWLRVGQLYLQKGNWSGEQVLSSEYIDLVTHPSPASKIYGGQIWLNTDGDEWPELPHDTYYFAGHQGQRVIVIPSENLVVVRTGVTEDYSFLNLGPAIKGIIDAIRAGENTQ